MHGAVIPMASTSAENEGTSAVTRLLRAYNDGEEDALDDLVPLVYDTLRRVAQRQLRGERDDHTLSSTALVHEAYIQLSRLGDVQWQDRRHFFAAAARTMRHILVDYAVRRNAQKRGGDVRKVNVDDADLPSEENLDELITLNRAMDRLEKFDDRLVRVVECRFFAGLTIEETAETLDISDATVSRYWTRARAWLNRELTRDA